MGVAFPFKVPIQKIIKNFRLIHSTIVFAESFFESSASLSDILHFTIFYISWRTYIKSSEFQSRSELLIIENCLPLIDEVTVYLVLKCLQHLHLLALHLEILGYIPHLLNGLVYLRRIADFKGDSLILRLL